MFFALTYYFISNYSWTFRTEGTDFTVIDRTNLSALYLFCAVTMLPMFTVLSCDYGRLYQYLFLSAYAVFLILPRDTCTNMFPKKYLDFIRKLNDNAVKYFPATKGYMVLLLLILATAPFTLNLVVAFGHSVIGTIFKTFFVVLEFVVKHVL